MSGIEASGVSWRRSSACLPSECVEVAAIGGYVLIRDSADGTAPRQVLRVAYDRWRAFIRDLASERVHHGVRDEFHMSVF